MKPEYNMLQIVKQSILAEEHLVHPRKRCSDCLAKHLLHMVALAEEAFWLSAGKRVPPLVAESVGAYNRLFHQWWRGPRTPAAYHALAGQLRALRKGLVAVYVNTAARSKPTSKPPSKKPRPRGKGSLSTAPSRSAAKRKGAPLASARQARARRRSSA